MRATVLQASNAAVARIAPVLALLQEKAALLQPLIPMATKAFHYSFIPLVLFLGMRSSPRPSLLDLLQPM